MWLDKVEDSFEGSVVTAWLAGVAELTICIAGARDMVLGMDMVMLKNGDPVRQLGGECRLDRSRLLRCESLDNESRGSLGRCGFAAPALLFSDNLNHVGISDPNRVY